MVLSDQLSAYTLAEPEAEEVALQMGCWVLELTTGEWRRDAHRFYERRGYTKTARRYSKKLR